ncbi:ABC transporter permease [Agriterribacter sp.]|uniref:ABC transporter permease n=1 Tax=Agriterribacter sp. TaxID=2821509 RepID=UPI002B9BD183|nr:ABC transporter permease [Agriterribacter sp.]HRP56159.1 ABC transporter permease [Agriterribacter sp.]
MFKLWSTIIKDYRILTRDKMGLTLMFVMPIILAIVIASVQNSTFELVNENKIPVLLLNKDTGEPARELETALSKVGMFDIKKVHDIQDEADLESRINTKDALVAIVIPANYSEGVLKKAKHVTGEALKNITLQEDSIRTEGPDTVIPVKLYYHPVLQQSFRKSIDGMLQSTLQFIQSKYIVKNVYYAVNEENIPDALERQIVTNQTPVAEIPVSKSNSRQIPNATQHNIPAWTIFAMFFIVISLGSSIVREKLNGSIIRLRTLPTYFGLAIVSKQITYVLVTLLQAAVIFSIGTWLFPHMGLPALNLPADKIALFFVTFICGVCATSFAICVGVFSNTQEQANGFGAVSVVLLAAVGGLLVPSFVMPASFQFIMRLSPLHWCLEAYYGLFLEGGNLQDIWMNIIPLLVITVLLQIIAFYGLRRKSLI